jgi:multiple sugar transport system substrate-binding protein
MGKLVMNKIILLKEYLFIVLFALIVLSCNNGGEANETVITYWCSNSEYEIQFAKIIASEWNESHQDYKIKPQPVPEGNSSEEVILAAVVGETTPDIYSNMWQGDVEAYAQAGVLIPLDTIPGFIDFIYERCDSSVVEEITSLDGHIYQIPWKINPIMQIYNERIIEELNLPNTPLTYSEYLLASKKFQKDFDGDGYIDRWFGYSEVRVTWWQRFFDFYPLYLAASNGAPLIKNNKAVFNNKHAINVFAFLRKLYEKDYFSKERLSARQDVFLAEVIATRFVGPWEITHANNFKSEGFRYSFDKMLVPDNHTGPVYTYGDPKNIVLFNTCKNPLKAWEFLKTVIDDKGDLMFLEMSSQIPRRKNLLENPYYEEYFSNNPKMEIFAKQAKYVKGTDPSPVLKEVFDLISQEYEACVVYGTKSPEQAIEDAAKAVDLLFLN